MARAEILIVKLRPRVAAAIEQAQKEQDRLRRKDVMVKEYHLGQRTRSLWDVLRGREYRVPREISDLIAPEDVQPEPAIAHYHVKDIVGRDLKVMHRLVNLCTLAESTGQPAVWVDEDEARILQKWWML